MSTGSPRRAWAQPAARLAVVGCLAAGVVLGADRLGSVSAGTSPEQRPERVAATTTTGYCPGDPFAADDEQRTEATVDVTGSVAASAAPPEVLDGVITPTAKLHRQAWARMFSAFLDSRGARPYTEQDYFDFLDGRRRDEGIQALLDSRGISLPLGSDSDAATEDTVHGLGTRKNEDFLALVAEGVDAYEGSVQLLDAIRDRGANGEHVPHIAIVSSSKNARQVLGTPRSF